MLYLADNLAYFPYMVQDEPLFIVHHIDVMISVSGTNLLQSFREGLIMSDAQRIALESGNQIGENAISALDEDDDEAALLARVPEDTSQLQACLTAAQGCLLLLMLKQHLKDVYSLSDGLVMIQWFSITLITRFTVKFSNIRRRNQRKFMKKRQRGAATPFSIPRAP